MIKMKQDAKHIVIIGGGFGGLNAALALRNKPVTVTLIDRRNFHLFQPLLYQVASGGLSPADIAYPLRAMFTKSKNIRVVMGEVSEIDLKEKYVFAAGQTFKFDELIIAAGAQNHYFGNDAWQEQAPGLKSLEDATTIRSRILEAFEKAEVETDTEKKKALLTFAIIGGGPAGVEMAGAIAEISRNTLRCDFKNINPADSRILLIEGGPHILSVYPEALSEQAKNSLQRLGVNVIERRLVKEIFGDKIVTDVSDIKAGTMIWAAGVRAAGLAETLAEKYGLDTDRGGRLIVNSNCTLADYPDVFVIGDMAGFQTADGQSLPGVAPVAVQQGKYAAKVILNRQQGKESKAFHYIDKGSLAVIGRKAAVAFRGRIKLSGLLAWLIWLFVHLLYLVGFQNRLLVAIQWASNYFTFGRSARLITGYAVNRENNNMPDAVVPHK